MLIPNLALSIIYIILDGLYIFKNYYQVLEQ